MTTRIGYNTTTAFGKISAEFVNDLITVRDTGARLKAALDSMALGTPTEWTRIESELGIAAGQGEAFYNTVAAVMATLNGLAGLPTIDQG